MTLSLNSIVSSLAEFVMAFMVAGHILVTQSSLVGSSHFLLTAASQRKDALLLKKEFCFLLMMATIQLL
jgi:hypothetical protein